MNRFQRIGELAAGACADYWNDLLAFRQRPGNSQLRRTKADFISESLQLFDKALVLGEILFSKAWQVGTEITRPNRSGAAQQSSGKNAIRRHADAEFFQ